MSSHKNTAGSRKPTSANSRSEKPSSSQLTTETKDESLTPELCDQVFGNDLILEVILSCAVLRGETVLLKSALTCRLVQKTWNKIITRTLQRKGLPLVTIDFDGFTDSYKRNCIQNLLKNWATPSNSSNCILPFDILIYSRYSEDELQELANCLTQCGTGLANVALYLHSNFGDTNVTALPSGIGQFQLPNLKTIDLCIDLGGDEEDDVNLTNTFLPLLQLIMAGCKQLNSFTLSCEAILLDTPLAGAIQKLQLPQTLNKIVFEQETNNDFIESLLLNNSLPNLTELQIYIPNEDNVHHNNFIFKILDRYRQTLKKFSAVDEKICVKKLVTTRIHFPVMSKLKSLHMLADNYRWPENASGLERFLPVMEKIELDSPCQNAAVMKEWMENSQYDTVKEVILSVYEIFTKEQALQLHTAFRNVLKLNLTIPDSQKLASIQLVFKEMVQLKKLSIDLRPTNRQERPTKWDPILLGIVPKYAVTLASSLRRGKAIRWDPHQVSSPSIVNLSELRQLHLKAESPYHTRRISDASFLFGFLQMDNLRELSLKGDFMPSDEMAQGWRARGRKITNE